MVSSFFISLRALRDLGGEKASCQPDAGDDHVNQLYPDERDDDAAQAIDEQVAPQQDSRAKGPVLHPAQRQRNQRNDDDGIENHG
jgi:hypothetical protein